MATATILVCDGMEWKLGDDGVLLVRDIGRETWDVADMSHALTATIKGALMNVAIVKALIDEAATDRLRAMQRR